MNQYLKFKENIINEKIKMDKTNLEISRPIEDSVRPTKKERYEDNYSI